MQLPRDDEERRLIAIAEACSAKERVAEDLLSRPRHSMLYPAYMRLVDALSAMRLKCTEARLAVRTHRKKMQSEGK
jgi:hypothetical protein